MRVADPKHASWFNQKQSMPSDCCSKIGEIASLDSSCLFCAAPARVRADNMRATDRALPWLLATPMSAARQPELFATDASTGGPVNVRTIGLSGSIAARSKGSAGGGTLLSDDPLQALARYSAHVVGAGQSVGLSRAQFRASLGRSPRDQQENPRESPGSSPSY
jgi:hypothetical protein